MKNRLGNTLRTGLAGLLLGASAFLGGCKFEIATESERQADKYETRALNEWYQKKQIEFNDYELNDQLNYIMDELHPKFPDSYAFYADIDGKKIPIAIRFLKNNKTNPTNHLMEIDYALGAQTSVEIAPCNRDIKIFGEGTEVRLNSDAQELLPPYLSTRKMALDFSKKIARKLIAYLQDGSISNHLERIPDHKIDSALNMESAFAPRKPRISEKDKSQRIRADLENAFK